MNPIKDTFSSKGPDSVRMWEKAASGATQAHSDLMSMIPISIHTTSRLHVLNEPRGGKTHVPIQNSVRNIRN